MGITVNGPSGIDTASLISQLTEMEMMKVQKIEAQKTTVSKKIDAYSQFETYLSDIASAAGKLDAREDFNMYTTTSSLDTAAKVSTSFGAQPGSYSLKIFQLAEREKLISKDGLITNNQTDLSALGITPGKFKINDVEITLEANDSIEDLRVKINSAKKEDGTKLGVSATVLKMSDNNYRFVLTSDETGSKGAEYGDISGNILASLGIISGTAGESKETSLSKSNMKTAFANLAEGGEIIIKGVDASGASFESTYTKADGDDESTFTQFVQNAFGNDVTASFDSAGKLKVEANTGGSSLIRMSSIKVSGTEQNVLRSVVGATIGSKGIQKETYESSAGLFTTSAIPGNELPAIGKKITIAGTDSNGKTVNATYVRSSTDTPEDFASFVANAFNGAVTATIDATGKLKLEDKNGGNSLFSVASFGVEASDGTVAANAFTRTLTGQKSSNVLSAGRDAFYSVDNINLTSSINKPSGVAAGVSFELKSVSYESVTTTISRDVSGLSKKVNDLLGAYNAVSRYVASSTKYAASDDKNSSSGVLVGDMTSKTINSKVRGIFMQNFNITENKTFTSLAQLGIKTNSTTGQYELDSAKFESALDKNYDEVISLFVNEGYTDKSSVMFGSKTKDTVEGAYDLIEESGEYKIKLKDIVDKDGNVTQTFPSYTATRSGDIINFTDGPAKGLYLTAPAGSGNSKITYSKGLAGRMTELIKSLTAADSGTLAIRKNSMNSQIKNFTKMADAMEKRVNSYTDRLTKQFSVMEQTMSALKSQSSAMMSQLGYS